MADVNIVEALALFTKVNTKMLDRVIKLEKTSQEGTAATKKDPSQVIEKAAPVEVESFGKKAIQDLSKIVGRVQVSQKKEELPKKTGKGLLDWLLGGLGLLGTGLMTLYDGIKKWLQDKLVGSIKKTIDILKDGIKKLWDVVKSGWKYTKEFFGKLGRGLANGAKWVGDKVKNAWDAIKESRFGKGIKSFFVKVGEKFTSFADKIVGGAKSLGVVLAEKFAIVKDAIKSLTTKASEALLGKEGARNILGKAVDVTKGAAKTVGGVVAKGARATYEGGKAISSKGAEYVSKGANIVKDVGSKVLSRGQVIAQVSKKLVGFKFTTNVLSKLIKKIPIIGSMIETFLTDSDIKELVEKHTKDPSKYTEEMLYNDIGKRISEGIGGILGSAGGATLGGIVGSVIPVGGNIVGAIGGGIAGDWVGRKVFGAIADSIGGDTKKEIGKFIYDKAYKDGKDIKGSLSTDSLKEEKVNDAAIYPGGNKIIKPHPDDSIYAMKEGGPMDKFFNKNIKVSEEGNTILKKYADISSNMLNKQTNLLTENNRMLSMLLEKLSTPTNIISRPTIIKNNFGTNSDLRSIQGVS